MAEAPEMSCIINPLPYSRNSVFVVIFLGWWWGGCFSSPFKFFIHFHFILLFFFFLLCRATPVACGNSQARGRIRAAAAVLHHSHGNMGSEPRL